MYLALTFLVAVGMAVVEYFSISNTEARWIMIALTLFIALLRYSFTIGRIENECYRERTLFSFYSEFVFPSDARWLAVTLLPALLVILITDLLPRYSVNPKTAFAVFGALLISVFFSSLSATKRMFEA